MACRYDQPDKGYAWVVLICICALNAFLATSFGPFGIILVEYLEHFACSTTEGAAIGATLHVTVGITGLFIGPLVKQAGARRMIAIGTLFVTVGLIASSFAKDISVLYFTHGFLTGIGYTIWAVCMSVVQLWFRRRRGLATALVSIGLCLGILGSASMTRAAIAAYSWRGALLLLAGVQLNGFVIAMLIRSPNLQPVQSTLEATDSTSHRDKREGLEGANDVKQDEADRSQDCDTQDEPASESSEPCIQPEKTSLKDLDDGTSIPGDQDHSHNGFKVSHTSTGDTTHRDTDKSKHTQSSVIRYFSNLFDLSLWRTPAICLFLVSLWFTQIGNFLPFMMLPLRVEEIGGTKSQAAVLVAVLGAASVPARLFFGWFSDQPWISRKWIYSIAQSVAGLATLVAYFMPNYKLLVAYCVVLSILIACHHSIQMALVTDLVGIARLANSYGIIVFITGMTVLWSTLLVGYLIEAYSCALPFLVTGILHTCGGVLLFIMCFIIIKESRAGKQSQAATTA